MSTTPLPLPDLDNDEIKYRFSRSGEPTRYGRTVYNIERSINGGPFVRIGTTVKTSDATWSSSANWNAASRDGEIRTMSTTREGAAKSLEYLLQGPEYAERERAAYQERAARERAEAAERARQADLRERAEALVLERHADEVEALIAQLDVEVTS